MPTRREFLIKSVAGALIVSMPRIVFANTNNKAINATAITQVFGDGVRLIAIAVEFEKPINKEELSTIEFSVKIITSIKHLSASQQLWLKQNQVSTRYLNWNTANHKMNGKKL